MTISNAKNLFERKHKDLTVTRIVDYDKDHFVLVAVKDPSKNDEVDPFYYVDKNDGSDGWFAIDDFEKFASLMGGGLDE